MARRNESIFEIAVDLSWRVSVISSGIVYRGLVIQLPSVYYRAHVGVRLQPDSRVVEAAKSIAPWHVAN